MFLHTHVSTFTRASIHTDTVVPLSSIQYTKWYTHTQAQWYRPKHTLLSVAVSCLHYPVSNVCVWVSFPQMFDWIMANKGLFLAGYTEIGNNHPHAMELQTQHNHFAMNCMVRTHTHTHRAAGYYTARSSIHTGLHNGSETDVFKAGYESTVLPQLDDDSADGNAHWHLALH